MTEHEPTDQVPDAALVLRMKKKDESALEKVLELYGPKVMGFLRRQFANDLGEPERDEAFNRAAFKVWRYADRFKPELGSLRGWFIRIARNEAISVLRGEERHIPTDDLDPSYDPAEDRADPSPDLDSEEYARLQQLNSFLHSKLRGFEQIVALNCFQSGGEADTARLAARFGKTRQNVDTVRSKVKRKITKAMLEWDLQRATERETNER